MNPYLREFVAVVKAELLELCEQAQEQDCAVLYRLITPDGDGLAVAILPPSPADKVEADLRATRGEPLTSGLTILSIPNGTEMGGIV